MAWESINPMKDKKDYLTQDEFTSILSCVKNPDHQLIFIILFKTGRRVSEVVGLAGLKVEDIDFEKGLINFTILKKRPMKTEGLTPEQRAIIRSKITPYKSLLPVKQELLNYLEKYCIGRSGRLFHVTRQYLNQVFKKAGKDAGLTKRVHLHMLRHSFAIKMAESSKNPADLEKLRLLLGHTNIEVTKSYLRFNPFDLREMVERV